MQILVGILGWLTGSTAGRIAAVVLLAVAAVAVSLVVAFRKGEAAADMRQTRMALDNLRDRISSDDAISRLDPAARRERLRRWARNGV